MIPALIAILGISLVVFFIKTQPLETPPEKGITGNLPEPEKPAVMLRAIPLEEDEPFKTTMVTDPGLPLVRRDGIVESDFTQWMSPLALDTYIRQKNRGFSQTFWERGHWIKAVEGRWSNRAHEFRIALSSNPEPDRIQWYYRIDQTEAEFAESIGRLENDGYTLAQSHAY